MSGKEGGRGGREGRKKKGGSVKFGLFVLRVEMIMRRKEQTKNKLWVFLPEKLQQKNSWGQDT